MINHLKRWFKQKEVEPHYDYRHIQTFLNYHFRGCFPTTFERLKYYHQDLILAWNWMVHFNNIHQLPWFTNSIPSSTSPDEIEKLWSKTIREFNKVMSRDPELHWKKEPEIAKKYRFNVALFKQEMKNQQAVIETITDPDLKQLAEETLNGRGS